MGFFRKPPAEMGKPAPAGAGKKEGSSWLPVLLAAVLAVVFSLLGVLDAFHSWDSKWEDRLFRWRGPESVDPRVVVIAIDDESLSKIGQFPWPRAKYRPLVERLVADGVKVVAFDMNFIEPSFPEQDRALIDVTAKYADRIVHAAKLVENAAHDAYKILPPFKGLAKVTKHLGVTDQPLLDSDGSIRRTNLMYGTALGQYLSEMEGWARDPERIPGLGLASLSVFQGRDPDEYTIGRSNIVDVNIRGQTWAMRGGFSYPKYAIPRISIWRILQDKLTDEERGTLRGAIGLIASTAVAAFDHYPNPFSPEAAGVEIHATVIDNLLHHRFLRPPSWALCVALCFAFAFLAAWGASLPPFAAVTLVVGLLLAWAGTSYAMFRSLHLVDFTAPSLSLLLTFSILFLRKTLSERQEKRFIKQTFGQFVAPEVVDKLVQDPSLLRLGGEKREMTVFFLDIAHFTTISEKMDPEALILFLNKYLSALSRVVHDHRGVVDKYIGDCIMAFWNAPLDDPRHRANACLTAVECQRVVEELNKDIDPRLPERPAIRIGVNSGDMTVGLTGSEKKLAYTVIGDEVNLASRLEGANKFFGSKIMVSEACLQGARDAVEARILGQVRVVGKSIPIKVYELLSAKDQLSAEWRKALPLYEAGVASFLAEKFAEAKDAFGGVLKHLPDDKPAKLYFNACEDYLAIPPMGDDWRVFNLTAK